MVTSMAYVYIYVPKFLEKLSSIPLRTVYYLLFYVLFLDIFRRLLLFFYRKGRKLPVLLSDNFVYGVNNCFRFLVFIGAVLSLFGLFGVELKALLTSLSIVAAALAIITKDYLNDFFIGLYFSFSRNFDIHDYVKFGAYKGKVVRISMLKIQLLNDDDDLVILPNSKVYNNEIINYTKRDIRSLSIDFQIFIKAVKDIQYLEEKLILALEEYHEYLEMDSFNLKIVRLEKDSMDLKFQYELKTLNREMRLKVRKRTVRQIFNFLSTQST